MGAESLSENELLALVLGTGHKDASVLEVSARILGRSGGLEGLSRMGVGQLCQLPGLGEGKAGRLMAAFELGRRARGRPALRGERIGCSRDVYESLHPRLADHPQERFVAIPLDARHRSLGELLIAVGGMTSCPVAPAEVFRALLREAAVAVIFAHNHPSGEPSPSEEDVALTERLVLSGELLGIRVLDHVIIGRESYFSFVDEGLLHPSGGRR